MVKNRETLVELTSSGTTGKTDNAEKLTNRPGNNIGIKSNFANPEIEHQFKNLKIENTKNPMEENNKISRIPNMNEKSHTTKLKENPMLRSYYYGHPETSSSMHTNMESSDFSFNTQNQNIVAYTSTIEEQKQIFEPSRYKCGGRGMIIQQVAESINHYSKNLGMSYSNSSIERHFKNLREKAKKDHKEENNKISRIPDMKVKSHKTKLRENPMLISYFNGHPQTSSSMQTDMEPSDFSFNAQNHNTVANTTTIEEQKQIFEPSRYKCGGRGMIIQQVAESINYCSKNLGMSYSNSSIERHFKNLREKAKKDHKEENNKISRIPDMKVKSHKTKLRENPMLISYFNGHPQTSSSMQTDMEPSDFSFNAQNHNTVANTTTIEEQKQIFEPSRYKCGGRGMIIQQVAESINYCSKNLGMSYSNSSIERHFKNLREKAKKDHKEENNKISRIPDMKVKSHKTKLRENPMLISYFNGHPQTSSSMQTDMEPSDFSFNAQNHNTVANTTTIEEQKQIFEPSRYKCGGRGMIIQQVAESINYCSKNLGMSYSNSSIERHFKNLREKAKKELDEENEKIWGPMLNSNNSN